MREKRNTTEILCMYVSTFYNTLNLPNVRTYFYILKAMQRIQKAVCSTSCMNIHKCCLVLRLMNYSFSLNCFREVNISPPVSTDRL